MTLLGSVCAGMVVLSTRSILWHAGVMLSWDGSWREWYRKECAKLRGGTPMTPDPRRTALKKKARKYTTPFGRALAEKMRPIDGEAQRAGRAHHTNPFVNVAARAVLVTGMALLLFCLAVLVYAGTARGLEGLSTELGVAFAANIAGLFLARVVERAGPAVTLAGAMLGALIGGLAAGFLLCRNLPFRLGAFSGRGSKVSSELLL